MSFETRKLEVISMAAEKALSLPLLKQHYWFFEDIRDNFYYAMHLFAASQDERIPLSVDREAAKSLAEKVLLHSIKLQDQNPQSPMFGHWPLNLYPEPLEAEKNTLPVEFFGSLLLYFYEKYKGTFSGELHVEINNALTTIYHSSLKDRVPELFNHHETKIFVIQLMFGQFFHDNQMKTNGYNHLKALYYHLTEYGLREYGALPWVWHRIQSITFAQEYILDEPIKQTLTALLNLFWQERSTFYLKGAWVGAHSRGLPHDIPKDENNLIDYIQFGDFPLPTSISRLEGAGFLSYQVPFFIRELALNHQQPVEVKKQIHLFTEEDKKEWEVLHHYAYITSSYAMGGMWERTDEYLNEQHRWDISLPVENNDTINQVYFFHPGEGFDLSMEDGRHQSPYSEVLYRKNVVCALFYNLPMESHPFIVGYLPKGEWIMDEKDLYGKVGDVYFAVHLYNPISLIEQERNLLVKSKGNKNGVVIEVLTTNESKSLNIQNLVDFKTYMGSFKAGFALKGGDEMVISYITTQGESLQLNYDFSQKKATRLIDDQVISFNDYMI
ncbi:hypothetical protein [Neobacillus cucumis]|uniref:hypothetical protein n=1 Tax=Neobacillus cucumis TaxID=1740721 RepID=UPI001964B40C|nr:hypothetical protein [Neobacillus cucumis]MBM7654331.1 hypothetical protein [Neobacillus cucumis]